MQKIALSDKLQITALAINVLLVIFFAIWNISQEERIAKLEYDELAPRVVIYREVKLDTSNDRALYNWVIRNNGRIAAENVILDIFSNAAFPFEDCTLGIPFDAAPKRVSGEHIIFENVTLPPQGTISAFCQTKTDLLKGFIETHKVSPEAVPSLNCEKAAAYDSNLLFLLPNLGISANNLEPSRIVYCVESLSDVYK